MDRPPSATGAGPSPPGAWTPADEAPLPAGARIAADAGATLRDREIDPDVFGKELDNPGYEDVDRIALVAAVLTAAPARG